MTFTSFYLVCNRGLQDMTTKDCLKKLQEDASKPRMGLAVSLTLTSAIAMGYSQGFTVTSAVVFIDPEQTTLEKPLDEEEISWIMSLPYISIMIFSITGGSIAEWIGRKRTLIIGQIIMMSGWVTLYFANDFLLALLGRSLTGIGVGMTIPVQTLHLSEIALIKMRGSLSMMPYLVQDVCNTFSLIIAATLPLQIVIAIAIIPSVIFLLGSFFLPESPMWLVKKGHQIQAKESLSKLRGPNYDKSVELSELENLASSKDKITIVAKLRELSSRKNVVPFLIMAIFMILQTMTGAEAIINYSLDIFRRANMKWNNYVLSILVQTGSITGYFISTFLMSRIKRKIQYISTASLMAAAQIILGCTLIADKIENESFINISEILMPICVMCCSFGYGLGVGPVTFALLGEILPLKVKSVATSIVIFLKFVVIFLYVKFFPTIVGIIGLHCVFWVHSGIAIFTCILAVFIMPETQGKTLTEISEMFSNSG